MIESKGVLEFRGMVLSFVMFVITISILNKQKSPN